MLLGNSDWVGSNELLIAGGGGGGGDQTPDPSNVVAANIAGPPAQVGLTWDWATSAGMSGRLPQYFIQAVQTDGEGNQLGALVDMGNTGDTHKEWNVGSVAVLTAGQIVQFFVQARDVNDG